MTILQEFLHDLCGTETVTLFENKGDGAEDAVAVSAASAAAAIMQDPWIFLDDEDGFAQSIAARIDGGIAADIPDGMEPSVRISDGNHSYAIYFLDVPVQKDLLPAGYRTDIPFPRCEADIHWAPGERFFTTKDGHLVPVEELDDRDVEPVGESAPLGESVVVGRVTPGDGVGVAGASGTAAELGDQSGIRADGSESGYHENGNSDTEPGKKAGTPINDALILGTFTDEQNTWLSTARVETMQGAMYGARSPRNTLDGAWTNKPISLIEFTGAITKHPAAKTKYGTCIVLGSSIEGARKAKAMDSMSFLGLDIDSGAQLDDVVKIIQAQGLMCFIYTTHSHGKTGLELDRDVVLRKLGSKENPSLEQVQSYLREHDKNRYEESFIQNVTITDHKKQVKEGIVIALDTPPLHKFRLLFPFLKPVKIVDLADTHQGALDFWEDSITGFAHTTLGVHFDTSCTDPSRLFFLPRHPKGAEFKSYVLAGDPLDFNNVPQIKKSTYTKNRELNAFILADDSDEGSAPPTIFLPSGASLNEWHSKGGKDRFMVADAIEHFCPDKVRRAGNEASGSIHIECPFEHEHTTFGGTGTMATNALDSTSDYWTIHCKHDACTGRHKTAFLGEMIERGWFEESVLFDKDWMLPADDDEDEDAAFTRAAAKADPEAPPKGPPPTDDLIAALADQCSEADIRRLYKRLMRREPDLVERVRIDKQIQKKTGLGLRPLAKFWKDLDKAAEIAALPEGAAMLPRVGEMGFKDLVEYGRKRIATVNHDDPRVFHYMLKLAVIRDDANAQAKIKFLDKEGFANLLNTVSDYQRSVSDTKAISCSAPIDVVSHIFSDDYGVYPALRGLVTSPTFSKSGKLILTEGYHRESSLYYSPNHTFVVPPISPTPTADEVREAVRSLVEDAFADFPLGAKTRPEIVEMTMSGQELPAVANLLALTLLPFIRDMISGPTPGHLLTKPAPGTGASLLTDVVSTICTGDVTPAMAMPGNKDEMGKTLTSVLANGQNIVFFDNINHSVDSGELASAMTANVYQARILGKSETMDCEVRCAWVLTGNNVKLSNELLRRLIMIDLDARLSSPEKRTGFLHKDLLGWVRKNRGRLVWACLTLVQNWIAKGMVDENSQILASYENWSRVIGGILRDAGVNGFMGNRDLLREQSSEGETDELLNLIEVWWEECGTAPVRLVDSSGKSDNVSALAIANDIELGIGKKPDANGEMGYPAKQLATYLAKYRGRIFDLENGQSVGIEPGPRMDKKPTFVVFLTTPVPESNVEGV